MDKLSHSPKITQQDDKIKNRSKEEIVNEIFDEIDNSKKTSTNILQGTSIIKQNSDNNQKFLNAIHIYPNSEMASKPFDDAQGIPPRNTNFNRPDSNIQDYKLSTNIPEEQITYMKTTDPNSAEEIAKKNRDINFDIILSNLKDDDKYGNNINIRTNYKKEINIEKDYKKDSKKDEKFNKNFPKIKKTLISEVSYGKTSSITQKFTSYMKNLVLNDITLTQIKYNVMKIDSNLLKNYNCLDNESIINAIPLIFEEALLNIDILEIKEQLEGYELTYMDRFPISYPQNIEFIKNSMGTLNKLDFNNSFKEYRKVVSDGNGFFRAFMISYLENIILNNKTIMIKKFIVDFCSSNEMTLKRNDMVLDKLLFLGIFSLITDCLEQNNIKKAYDYFIKSIYIYRLDIFLIKYLRIEISKYIEVNLDVINNFLYKNNSLEYYLITPYFTDDNHEINLKKFFEESLLCLNCQADKFLLFLAPLMFDVNLCLYYIDTNSLIQDYFFSSKDSSNKLTINLLYNCFDYYILYNSFLADIVNNKIYPTEVAIVYNILYCEDCRKETEIILFNYIKDFFYCRECIRKLINYTMTNRTLNFLNENYYNFEYYCRPINFEIDRYLCDEECLFLTGKTFPQYLLEILSTHLSNSLCPRCGNIEDSLQFTCGCKCKNCMINYIQSFTQNKVILNYYEKSKHE